MFFVPSSERTLYDRRVNRSARRVGVSIRQERKGLFGEKTYCSQREGLSDEKEPICVSSLLCSGSSGLYLLYPFWTLYETQILLVFPSFHYLQSVVLQEESLCVVEVKNCS